MSYTTRYTHFARVRGFELGSPQTPLMHEYISWIKSKWAEWKKATGHKNPYLNEADHAAFDAWLAKEAA